MREHHFSRNLLTSEREPGNPQFESSMPFSFFSFLPGDSFRLSRAAPVAILPSAFLVERFSLGAWWAFPIQ